MKDWIALSRCNRRLYDMCKSDCFYRGIVKRLGLSPDQESVKRKGKKRKRLEPEDDNKGARDLYLANVSHMCQMCFVEEGVLDGLVDVSARFKFLTGMNGMRVCGFCAISRFSRKMSKKQAKTLFKLKDSDLGPLESLETSQRVSTKRNSFTYIFVSEDVLAAAYRVYGSHSKLSTIVRKCEEKRRKSLATRKKKRDFLDSCDTEYHQELRRELTQRLSAEGIDIEPEAMHMDWLCKRDGIEWTNYDLLDLVGQDPKMVNGFFMMIKAKVSLTNDRMRELDPFDVPFGEFKKRLIVRRDVFEGTESMDTGTSTSHQDTPGSLWADLLSYHVCYNFTNFCRNVTAREVAEQVKEIQFLGNKTTYVQLILEDSDEFQSESEYLRDLCSRNTPDGPFLIHFARDSIKKHALKDYVTDEQKKGTPNSTLLASIPSSLVSLAKSLCPSLTDSENASQQYYYYRKVYMYIDICKKQ
jgi:hypothetical protein